MREGRRWVPACGCLKQRIDVQSGGAPGARETFAGKMCVQRKDVQSVGLKNKKVGCQDVRAEKR